MWRDEVGLPRHSREQAESERMSPCARGSVRQKKETTEYVLVNFSEESSLWTAVRLRPSLSGQVDWDGMYVKVSDEQIVCDLRSGYNL